MMILYNVDLSTENSNIEEVERAQARVLAPFLSENGYTLCLFWSGIGYGFWGPTGVYKRIYRFNSKWVRKKEKYANSKWI